MENNNQKAIQNGDLSTLRNILIGQQMEAISEKFNAMTIEINQLKSELSELKSSQKQNVQVITQKVETTVKTDRQEMGELMMQLGEQLLKKR